MPRSVGPGCRYVPAWQGTVRQAFKEGTFRQKQEMRAASGVEQGDRGGDPPPPGGHGSRERKRYGEAHAARRIPEGEKE
ncbi:poly-beta-hydroxybutyrate polymerase [Anopheles sinensis]|uniref:Poly-beta-hydroxybutyrate polymerase n=1 Tax=Anopheles sinensis TaxID=74873 RepID=A0A084WGJ2_ANOSI|nr:poly-beta-hydroxybutyrate polymerase [Anopheles sinensis]